MTSYDCTLKTGSRLLIIGASGAGKTSLAVDLLINHEKVYERKPTNIYVFYQHFQPAYEQLKKRSKIPVHFINQLPDKDFIPQPESFILIDDFMENDSPEIASYFTRFAHHYKTDIIMLSQNAFAKGASNRLISLNANYLCVFRPRRDVSQLSTLNYQLLGAGHQRFLEDVYKSLSRNGPYSYIFIDLNVLTPDNFKFRSSIIPEAGKTRVFVPT